MNCSIRRQMYISTNVNNYYQISKDSKIRQLHNSSAGLHKDHLEAIPFTIFPQEALQKFDVWAMEHSFSMLVNHSTIKINPYYLPFYSFDLNIRYVNNNTKDNKLYSIKPEPMMRAYKHDTVHLPGVGAYAGYMFPRRLVNTVHSSSLIYIQEKIKMFLPWMLDNVTDDTGYGLPIQIDPWNSTKGTALNIALQSIERQAKNNCLAAKLDVQTELVSFRRVLMPTYVVHYRVFGGAEFQAFISGCDHNATVGGVSLLKTSPPEFDRIHAERNIFYEFVHQPSSLSSLIFSGMLQSIYRILLLNVVHVDKLSQVQENVTKIRKMLKKKLKKVSSPYMSIFDGYPDEQQSTVSQQQHTFRDDGRAKLYYNKNKEQILELMAGDAIKPDYSDDSETWFAYQRDAIQTSREQYNAYKEQQWYQDQSDLYFTAKMRKLEEEEEKEGGSDNTCSEEVGYLNADYTWDFEDPSDPYSVLEISQQQSGSNSYSSSTSNIITRENILQAFRRQMLKYNQDGQLFASKDEQRRAVEHTLKIKEAFRYLLKNTKI